MTEQNNKVDDEPGPHMSETYFSPLNNESESKVCSMQASSSDVASKTALKDYSIQLVELIDAERDLATLEHSLSMSGDASVPLSEVIHKRQDNREKIELLFAELSRKMWKGQLPPTTVAIVERYYKELTDRLLNEELQDEQWSAYFSAFQLSIDILNGKTTLS